MTDERQGLPSASSLDSDIRCLGRRALCRKVKAPPESEASAKGTLIHAWLAGEKVDVDCSDRTLAARILTEETRLLIKYEFTDSTCIREKRLWVLSGDMEKMYSCRVDVCYGQPKRALVIDYKTGYSNILPLPRNWQMKCQVACVAFNYGVEEVVAALIHPNEPDALSQSMTFNHEAIERIFEDIQGYLTEMTDSAPRTPNGISCQYCAAKEVCPERKAWLAGLEAPDGSFLKPDYESLSPQERGERLRKIKAWRKAADAEIAFYESILAQDGASVEGWRLVGGSTRTITNPSLAYDRLLEALGNKAMACLDVNLSALEAVLAESGTGKKDIPDKVAEILGDAITKKDRKPSLKEI